MSNAFDFVGGEASLDLVNTLQHRQAPGGPDELLTSGGDARRWFELTGLLSNEEVSNLDAEAALYTARRLRAALDAVYRPLAQRHDDPDALDRGLSTLNAVLDQGRERVQVVHRTGLFERDTHLEVLGPLDPSVRVARSAADFLHRLEPRRLKQCENPECDLLFYDESRNVSRRWCSMQGCGNVHKQTTFRRQKRADQETLAQTH